jgi:hypothetical protein
MRRRRSPFGTGSWMAARLRDRWPSAGRAFTLTPTRSDPAPRTRGAEPWRASSVLVVIGAQCLLQYRRASAVPVDDPCRQTVEERIGGARVRLRRQARAARGALDRASVRPSALGTRAAASPPRACARPAERSSSAATSSSWPWVACARCQARRSGSRSGSVTSANTPVHALPIKRGRRAVCRRSHQRMTEAHAGADREQLCSRSRLQRRHRDPEPLRPAPQQRRVADRLRRRDQ